MLDFALRCVIGMNLCCGQSKVSVVSIWGEIDRGML